MLIFWSIKALNEGPRSKSRAPDDQAARNHLPIRQCHTVCLDLCTSQNWHHYSNRYSDLWDAQQLFSSRGAMKWQGTMYHGQRQRFKHCPRCSTPSTLCSSKQSSRWVNYYFGITLGMLAMPIIGSLTISVVRPPVMGHGCNAVITGGS